MEKFYALLGINDFWTFSISYHLQLIYGEKKQFPILFFFSSLPELHTLRKNLKYKKNTEADILMEDFKVKEL